MDNMDGTAATSSLLFAMSGDGVDDIKIPMVFLFSEESKQLMEVNLIYVKAAITIYVGRFSRM